MQETRTNRGPDLRHLTLLALFAAIIVVMANVPLLGYIPLGFMNATTIHIPVIIGACLLGPKSGAFLGGVFGLTSLINNTLKPLITSFVFTPFYSLDPRFSGGLRSLVICFIPRILIGIVAGLIFKWLKERTGPFLACGAAGFLGSMTNTVFVMGGIYLLYGASYAEARNIGFETLLGVIMGVVGVNGVPEAILAAFLTIVICPSLYKVLHSRKLGKE
ncbi:ECF transporter S component [Oscillospiraceae bacterium LTW-04]|nr:ECF transporter S component [Oscillospiraceae bacterium MB24-C1]